MRDNLNIGAVIFPEMDQIDFTGPFETVVCSMPALLLAPARSAATGRDQ
jgi:hypothetical protein